MPERPAGRLRSISTRPRIATSSPPNCPASPATTSDINVQDGTLTLEGRRQSPPVPCERYHRVERGHGAFRRRFSVPVPIDSQGVSADLKDGVLTVTLPKSADALPRRIEVS